MYCALFSTKKLIIQCTASILMCKLSGRIKLLLTDFFLISLYFLCLLIAFNNGTQEISESQIDYSLGLFCCKFLP